MKSKSRISLAVAMAAMATSALVACSSSTTTPESAGPSMVGGMTECTDAAVGAAAQQSAEALSPDNVFTMENLQCSDGWAVATGNLGTGSTDANAPQGVATSFIFQAEGQFWVPQDKAKVCGSDPAATQAPADATTPADLYLSGCAAG
jgi:hypothetical protein